MVLGGAVGFGTWRLVRFVTEQEGFGVFLQPLRDGAITFVRVAVVVVASTVLWVPVGARIGLHPRVARVAQPLVQVLASFPANFLFPLATWAFIRTGLSLDVGGMLLMSLGAQWYILFNAIAGAMSIPTDLVEAMDDLGVHGWQRWRRLILPGVLPACVTGGLSASGGAWNASIVAEIVTYGGVTLKATGLGAYIATATEVGDSHHVLAGVAVMSLYVVCLNRFFWQPLSEFVTRRFAVSSMAT